VEVSEFPDIPVTVRRRLRLRGLLILATALTAVIGGAAIVILQDAFMLALLAPRVPFQVAPAPPAPDYAQSSAWHLRPLEESDAGSSDIFYVHSTTYDSRRGWNAAIDEPNASQTLARVAAPNEIGPFLGVGRVYAPRYRQATLFAFFTHKYDGVAARRLAYQDVRRAFESFLSQSESDRPILLVGYGQGGLHVLGILQDFFQTDAALRQRLAAAYVIGQIVPLDLFESSLALTPPCGEVHDARCVLTYSDLEPRFDEEIRRARERSMVWTASGDLTATKGRALLCINPVTRSLGRPSAPPDSHLGAASATGLRLGESPPPVRRAIGARCEDGVLIVDPPRQDFLRRKAWFGSKWRAPNYNLFYYDLAEDAAARLLNVEAMIDAEGLMLEPIDDFVDVDISPVNKVPNP